MINFVQLQDQFIEHQKTQGRGANTLKNYKTDLECFNGHLKELNLQPEHFNYRAELVHSFGQYVERKYVAVNSRRRRIQTLRVFFDYLLARGHILENHVRHLASSPKYLDIPCPTPYEDIKKIWFYLEKERNNPSTGDLSRLIALRNQMVILLIYYGGLKVSDLSCLRKSNIIGHKNSLSILIEPEQRDPYTIPLPLQLKERFEFYQHEVNLRKEKENLIFDDFLFYANAHCMINGNLGPRGVEMIFKEFSTQLNLTFCTAKSLRQACIFRWLELDLKPSLIKEWLNMAPSYSLAPYQHHLYKHKTNTQLYLTDLNLSDLNLSDQSGAS